MTRDKASTYATFRKRRSLRLPSHNYAESRPYHVTWGTHRGRSILLADAARARAVAECIEAEANRTPADLYAYCVMPDHVHVLLVPRDGGNAIRFVQAVKSRTAHAYAALGGTEKLWQRGFYDRIVRREEDVSHLAEYILANPVRAGLAQDTSTYPFSRLFPTEVHERRTRTSHHGAVRSTASELGSDVTNVAHKVRRYGGSRTSHTNVARNGAVRSTA